MSTILLSCSAESEGGSLHLYWEMWDSGKPQSWDRVLQLCDMLWGLESRPVHTDQRSPFLVGIGLLCQDSAQHHTWHLILIMTYCNCVFYYLAKPKDHEDWVMSTIKTFLSKNVSKRNSRTHISGVILLLYNLFTGLYSAAKTQDQPKYSDRKRDKLY